MSTFQFKQFAVEQEGATMKINTDGVLLAAFCDTEQPVHSILDIGTGTGVIALMLAQRYADAQLLGIDIDAQTVDLAAKNFNNSIFGSRMRASCADILEMEHHSKFDLMISNPPFYTNALKNPDVRKQQARHTELFFFEQLLQKAYALSTDDAEFWMIVPFELSVELAKMALTFKWFANQKIKVYNHQMGKCIRVIFRFAKAVNVKEDTVFHIRNEQNSYSAAYKHLLKDYFL